MVAYLDLIRLIRGRRDDFGTGQPGRGEASSSQSHDVPAPVVDFVSQFRGWCFSGELTQLAYQIRAARCPHLFSV